MKFVAKEKRSKYQNSKNCIAYEYPLEDIDINCALINLNGRYPVKGRVMNIICKEIGYIIKGSGKIVVEGKIYKLKAGDQILIEPNEKYYWQGNMEFVVPCTPAWSSDQHIILD